MDVIPYFQIIIAAVSVGMMEAATTKSAAHAANSRFAHLDQSIADLPTIRAYLARTRINFDVTDPIYGRLSAASSRPD